MIIKIISILGLLLFCMIGEAQSYKEIPSMVNGRMIVEVYINGNKTSALIDTGSKISIVDSNAKKKLGFRHRNKLQSSIIDFDGSSSGVYIPKNIDIKIGGLPMPIVLSSDIGVIVSHIIKETGLTISMIIGLNDLNRLNAIIDLQNYKLLIPIQNGNNN